MSGTEPERFSIIWDETMGYRVSVPCLLVPGQRLEVVEAAAVDAETRGLARDLTATRRDLSDTLRENAELEQFVRLCATGKRPGGTYNLGREALEQQARKLLERELSIGYDA